MLDHGKTTVGPNAPIYCATKCQLVQGSVVDLKKRQFISYRQVTRSCGFALPEGFQQYTILRDMAHSANTSKNLQLAQAASGKAPITMTYQEFINILYPPEDSPVRQTPLSDDQLRRQREQVVRYMSKLEVQALLAEQANDTTMLLETQMSLPVLRAGVANYGAEQAPNPRHIRTAVESDCDTDDESLLDEHILEESYPAAAGAQTGRDPHAFRSYNRPDTNLSALAFVKRAQIERKTPSTLYSE